MGQPQFRDSTTDVNAAQALIDLLLDGDPSGAWCVYFM